MPNPTPSRRCTRSRSTKAAPIISTPDGARMPGATGSTQGPLAGTRCRHGRSSNWRPGWSDKTARGKCRLRCFCASFDARHSFRLSPLLNLRIALRAQLAGRALAAAIAPVVPVRCGRPDSSYGSPRPRVRATAAPPISSASAKVSALSIHINGVWMTIALVEAESERHLHGLDGVVAAVGIAGIIGLAHAGDQMAGAAPIGQRAGEA